MFVSYVSDPSVVRSIIQEVLNTLSNGDELAILSVQEEKGKSMVFNTPVEAVVYIIEILDPEKVH